jgi:WD40 repeat protein
LSDYRDLSVTNDAGILAVTQSDQASNLWSVDPSAPNDSRQITSGKYDGYYGVDWKPDGQIVYASSNGSNQDLWQADVSGRQCPAANRRRAFECLAGGVSRWT